MDKYEGTFTSEIARPVLGTGARPLSLLLYGSDRRGLFPALANSLLVMYAHPSSRMSALLTNLCRLNDRAYVREAVDKITPGSRRTHPQVIVELHTIQREI